MIERAIKINNLMFQDFYQNNKIQKANWQSGCNYCKELKLLGFEDWRLPTIDELKIVLKYRHYFNTIQGGWYWSATKYNSNYSFRLYFDGYNNDDSLIYGYYILCVRESIN